MTASDSFSCPVQSQARRATGAGVAVDAASRGLRVALVERDDFSAGTSSKSTKLVHGGVRYLQKAVFELDYDQYKLVKEALHERKIFLETAPYLSNMLPIMLPIYKYWQVPYYLAGCKMYDILAGKENMETSYVMSKGKALETFPMLKSDGLVGAVVYYDGQHNDSRMNIALILTAVKQGAKVANYCEVTALHKDPVTGKLIGAQVKDTLPSSSQSSFNIRAKGIINATGPFTDSLLALDNPNHKPIVQASSGVHITLPNYYSPRTMGLLDPSTSDGRVIFFLPWQGNTIAGTTDSPSRVTRNPQASEEDIRWVLDEVRSYLSPDIKVRRGDVLSAWSGLRPLVKDPDAAPGTTAGLVRSHVTTLSESGLLTIAGGKWTTYRKMAEETVDQAIKVFGLEDRCKNSVKCVTEKLQLVGSEGWSRNMFIGLIQTYGLESEVARHLSDNYGSRAWSVCALAEPTNLSWPLHGTRLSPQYPFIDAEVVYAVRNEYALTAIDVLARRTRLSFLNARAALDTLPTVVDIMSRELGWRDKDELARALVKEVDARWSAGRWGWVSAIKGIFGFGRPHTVHPKLSANAAEGATEQRVMYGRARFQPSEIIELRKAFAAAAAEETAATEKKGEETVRVADVLSVVRALPGYKGATEKDLKYVVGECGLDAKERVDLDEFIEICGNLKDVAIAPTASFVKPERSRIPVEKSGGGV
ncbi:hypothetical protein NMY22_g4709 [Coprinellus aureogranulatus]|nr:hypothetical protein NMY22_g4709 [Coprinellus aureogranulatus]